VTAINVAAQHKFGCVHVAVDAASYTREHIVTAFGTKVFPVPHWPGLITNAGNGGATILLGTALSQEFQSFDSVIEGSDKLPQIVGSCGLPTGADVLLVGISEKRGPECYLFRTNDDLPLTTTRENAEASPFWPRNACELVKLPDIIMTPIPNDQIVPALFEGIDLDADPELVIWSLRKHLEMQRQMKLPPGIGGIGGFGQVTTISAAGITQRMLQRWPDKVGSTLHPERIDWAQWHLDNPKPGAEAISRVRRNMLECKERKSELRVVR
jgi:hypothetical protein